MPASMIDPKPPHVYLQTPSIHSCPYCRHRGMQVAIDLGATDGQVYGRCLSCNSAFALPFKLDENGTELRMKALRASVTN